MEENKFNWKYYLKHFQDDKLCNIIVDALDMGVSIEECQSLISGTSDTEEKTARLEKYIKYYDLCIWECNYN